jgi:hypothetical protein
MSPLWLCVVCWLALFTVAEGVACIAEKKKKKKVFWQFKKIYLNLNLNI